jgi:hypothetical protein
MQGKRGRRDGMNNETQRIAIFTVVSLDLHPIFT